MKRAGHWSPRALANCALAMALAAADSAAVNPATLSTPRSASASRHAHSCAPAGVDSSVSATDCSA